MTGTERNKLGNDYVNEYIRVNGTHPFSAGWMNNRHFAVTGKSWEGKPTLFTISQLKKALEALKLRPDAEIRKTTLVV